MMKKLPNFFFPLMLAISLIIGKSSAAQNAAPNTNISDVKINSAPAYVILGVDPENIDRPGSPEKFVAGVQAGLVNGKVKPNVAVEFNPFNWSLKPDSSHIFIANKFLSTNSNAESFKRNFSISLATSESDTTVYGHLRPGTAMAVGVQFLLIGGNGDEVIRNKFLEWEKLDAYEFFLKNVTQPVRAQMTFALMEILERKQNDANEKKRKMEAAGISTAGIVFDSELTADDTSEVFNNVGLLSTDNASMLSAKILAMNFVRSSPNYADVDRNAVLLDLNTKIDQLIMQNRIPDATNQISLRQALKDVSGITEQKRAITNAFAGMHVANARMGHNLQLSIAQATVFEGGKAAYGKFAKASFALTYSYRWDLSNPEIKKNISMLDAMVVLRGTINSKMVDSTGYIDFGGKLQYTINRFSASGECLGRFLTQRPANAKSNFTYRVTGNIAYKLNDVITFKAAVGVNFDGNSKTYSSPKDLFSIAGLNLGVGNLISALTKTK
jgi:hypothetical protein